MAALHTLSDEELVDSLKSGSHAAFTEIYTRYWDKLYVTAYSRLADELEAEEAVQNLSWALEKNRDVGADQRSDTTRVKARSSSECIFGGVNGDIIVQARYRK